MVFGNAVVVLSLGAAALVGAGCSASSREASTPDISTASSSEESDAGAGANGGAAPQPKACQPIPPSDVSAVAGGDFRVLVMMKGSGVACGYQQDDGPDVTIRVNRFDATHPPTDATRPVLGEDDYIVGVVDARVGDLDGWVETYDEGAQLYVADDEREIIVNTDEPLRLGGSDDVAILTELGELALERL